MYFLNCSWLLTSEPRQCRIPHHQWGIQLEWHYPVPNSISMLFCQCIPLVDQLLAIFAGPVKIINDQLGCIPKSCGGGGRFCCRQSGILVRADTLSDLLGFFWQRPVDEFSGRIVSINVRKNPSRLPTDYAACSCACWIALIIFGLI